MTDGGGRFWSLGFILLLKLVVRQQRGKVLCLVLTLCPSRRSFLLAKAELVLPRGAVGQAAVGQEAPSLQERWGVRERLRLEEGEMVQGRGDAGQGRNSPLTRPQSNAKRDPQGPTYTAQFAATQKLLAAVGLK